jgi:hypothetical protein
MSIAHPHWTPTPRRRALADDLGVRLDALVAAAADVPEPSDVESAPLARVTISTPRSDGAITRTLRLAPYAPLADRGIVVRIARATDRDWPGCCYAC